MVLKKSSALNCVEFSTSSAVMFVFFSVVILQRTAVPEEGHLVVECEVKLIPSGSAAGEQVQNLARAAKK